MLVELLNKPMPKKLKNHWVLSAEQHLIESTKEKVHKLLDAKKLKCPRKR